MSTEEILKPCPFCGGLPKRAFTPGVWEGYCLYSYVCPCGVNKRSVEEWNKRAGDCTRKGE